MSSYENSFRDALSEQEVLWALAIKMMPGIGDLTAKRLVSFCGSLESVFLDSKEKLLKIPGVGKLLARSVETGRSLELAEKEMAFALRNGIRVIPYLDPAYPSRLRQCDDGPIVLFVKGDIDLNAGRVISIVGTRNATEYGRRLSRETVQGICGNVDQVISGLAYGIDVEAHKASLDCGIPTLAVLAHGLDRVYPALHRSIARQIAESGALISECLSGALPDRENFPKRNRIIAGMSDAVLVVEAAERGGALITADIADSYNRDVFAVPGRTDDPYSKGCLNLIRRNKAALVTGSRDLLYAMRWDEDQQKTFPQKRLFPDAEPEFLELWEILTEPKSIDEICELTQWSQGKLNGILLRMEIEGWLRCLPGNRWHRQ